MVKAGKRLAGWGFREKGANGNTPCTLRSGKKEIVIDLSRRRRAAGEASEESTHRVPDRPLTFEMGLSYFKKLANVSFLRLNRERLGEQTVQQNHRESGGDLPQNPEMRFVEDDNSGEKITWGERGEAVV